MAPANQGFDILYLARANIEHWLIEQLDLATLHRDGQLGGQLQALHVGWALQVAGKKAQIVAPL